MLKVGDNLKRRGVHLWRYGTDRARKTDIEPHRYSISVHWKPALHSLVVITLNCLMHRLRFQFPLYFEAAYFVSRIWHRRFALSPSTKFDSDDFIWGNLKGCEHCIMKDKKQELVRPYRSGHFHRIGSPTVFMSSLGYRSQKSNSKIFLNQGAD